MKDWKLSFNRISKTWLEGEQPKRGCVANSRSHSRDESLMNLETRTQLCSANSCNNRSVHRSTSKTDTRRFLNLDSGVVVQGSPSFLFTLSTMWLLTAFAVAAVPATVAAASEEASAASAVPAAAAAATNLELGFLGLRPLEDSPNVVFSPLSILSVLALAAEGASGECKLALDALLGDSSSRRGSRRMREALLLGTKPQLEEEQGSRTFRSQAKEAGSPISILEVFTRVYVDSEVGSRPEFQQFKEDMQQLQLPSSAVRSADFSKASETAAEMNSAVSAATRGKIVSLVSPSTVQSSSLVLLNAVYFNSSWRRSFDPDETFPGLFFPVAKDGLSEHKEIPFMHKHFNPGAVAFYRGPGVEVVGLPYTYSGAWLFLYKPEDPSAFAQQLASSPSSLAKLVDAARQTRKEQSVMLSLSLPKFHLTADNNRFDAAGLLQRMGLAACMRDGAFDRLGGEGSGLHFSALDHQADINVGEKGTEAAAATAAIVTYSGYGDFDAETVSFDTPFFFELRLQADVSQPAVEDLVVFAGRVGDPSEA
ncbi:hypothetical protein Emag_005526 [Eimeria magna]